MPRLAGSRRRGTEIPGEAGPGPGRWRGGDGTAGASASRLRWQPDSDVSESARPARWCAGSGWSSGTRHRLDSSTSVVRRS